MALKLVAVLEHRESEGDDADVENGAEDVACAWHGEGFAVSAPELEVFGFCRIRMEAVLEGFAAADDEDPDPDDGEGGGDENGVEEAFPFWG